MRAAHRLDTLPPYLFKELDRLASDLRRQGKDVINLGIGDPDRPTPEPVVEALVAAAHNPANHRYPDYAGHPDFRQAVAAYYARRFGVELDPATEVLGLIGSKEGIAHLIWAWADPGDVVLVPDPAYPVYRTQALLAGAEPYDLPLRPETGFLPDLAAIPPAVLSRARMLWLNYPNNPTGAVATRAFYEEAVAFARRHDLLLCSDAAYVETGFDGYRAPSVLEVPGAKEVAVEFYSLSKPFNMTGWRIAAAVGNRTAIDALGTLKSHLDSGPFTAVQRAAIQALSEPEGPISAMNDLYRRRRDMAVSLLREMGLPVTPPLSTFYLWVPNPRGWSSAETARFFLERSAVVVTPGNAYGAHGEGWFRISLTISDERLRQGLERMAAALGA
ncbi:MAG: LL-diaminopimelate aminotransferase [Firmicutes bacterium]|nr:LL-diaminopimelate aminotransferase [Bacillota bacterium]